MVYKWRLGLRSLLTRLGQQLPSPCLLCGCHYPRADFCPDCLADLPWLPPSCHSCALPLPDPDTSSACGQCLKAPPSFSRSEACWLYKPPLAKLITDYKYQRDLVAGRSLASLMAESLQQRYTEDEWPDLITAVPLHWWRQWRRGFNQSENLARQLAAELQLPYQNLLTRQRATRTQQSLDARQRQQNLKGAFHCSMAISGKIALVDDVMTTGATAEALSQVLLKAGATEVHIWCLARTPRTLA